MFTLDSSGRCDLFNSNRRKKKRLQSPLQRREILSIRLYYWWLVELPMWLTDGFSVTFLEGGGEQCAYTLVTCSSRVAHAAHVWHLTCMVITIWWRGALTCGPCSSCVAINVHSNYYMVEGSPDVWQLTFMVITIWWRGALTSGSCVAHAAHVWQLTCTVITTWWRGALMCGN